MKQLVSLLSLFVLCTAGLAAQGVQLSASVNTGLKGTYQDGAVSFGSNAENTAIVGDTAINGSVGVLTAVIGDSFFGATVGAAVGSGSSTITSAWGWYKPLNWMTISAGTTNMDPFPSVDTAGSGSFAGPGVAATVDLAPLQFGGAVASQAGATGKSPNLTLTGGARLTLENFATVNVILGTIETIWLEWFHGSVSISPIPGFAISGGYSGKTLTTAFTDTANVGLTFGVTPEVGISTSGTLVDSWSPDRYFTYTGGIAWAIAPGLSLSGSATGDTLPYPSSTGTGVFVYQPYAPVTVSFTVSHQTNPGHVAVPKPLTSASVDFTFSL